MIIIPQHVRPLKILLVDDDIEVIHKVQPYIERGFNIPIKVISDPEEAFETLIKNPPDILFLDLNMPSLHGFEFLQRMDEHLPNKNQIATVILTLNAEDFAIELAFKFGAWYYLMKEEIYQHRERAVNRLIKRYEADFSRKVFSS